MKTLHCENEGRGEGDNHKLIALSLGGLWGRGAQRWDPTFLPPIMAELTAPASQLWRCDVCKVATFNDFKAACDHEASCGHISTNSPSPPKKPPADAFKVIDKLIDMTTSARDMNTYDTTYDDTTYDTHNTTITPTETNNNDKKRTGGRTGEPGGGRLEVGGWREIGGRLEGGWREGRGRLEGG